MGNYRLGDVCEIVSGSTPKSNIAAYWNGTIKWITPAEIDNDTYIINDSVRKITELAVEKTGLSLLPKGTVILSSRAPIGKVAIAGCDMYCNQGFKNLICSSKINNKYLYWFLKGNTEYLNSLGRGATFKEISKEIVANIKINIPLIERQLDIAEQFEKINMIVQSYRQELKKLDELIKARFVEMFGNPVFNDKSWPQKNLGEITVKIGSGATPKGGKESYGTEGITLIRSMNVHNGQFEYKDLAYISDEQASHLDNVAIEKGDILLNITGASVARCCVVPFEVLPARVNQHVCIIRCKNSILPEYLNYLLIDDNYQGLLWKIAGSGATREAITKQQVERLQIIMPPLQLQEKFVVFVKQTDKSKVVIQKALDKAQLLFDSLMQKYFG